MQHGDQFRRTGVSRRAMLGGAAAGAVLAGSAWGQQPAPRAKGPPVWRDMDQKELDDAYNQDVYAPNRQQLIDRAAVNSDGVRARLGAPKRFAYGAAPVEGLDVYPTKRVNAPIHVFVHGGAWRGGSAKASAVPAELFVHAGAHYIALDFNNVLETNGDLLPMADQVRRGIAWVGKNAATFGGDPARIYLSGFSSGAHLAGVALTTDWKELGVPADLIKGALLCSGLYDLKAPRLSARAKYVAFTDAAEQALSPQRQIANINCPVILAHGTLETPEFIRQTREFAAALQAARKTVQLLVADGYNHFEIAETLGNPYGLLGRTALQQMRLAPA
jgi:arylformamidase